MKLGFIHLSIAVILISCGESEQHNPSPEITLEDTTNKTVEEAKNIVEPTPCQETLLAKNSDSFTCLDYGDSIIYSYENYTVKTSPHPEYNGSIIEIRYHKYGSKVIVGKENSAFFMGLYGDNAIIDAGTGQIRQLTILDAIVTDRTYFKDSYVNDLRIENGFLYLEQPIEEEYVNPKPECPEKFKGMEDYIGYVGVYQYDFKSKSLAFTGEYKCEYFE